MTTPTLLPTPVRWDDTADAIIGGDLTAALAYVTPAGGVVVVPIAPIGLRDRERGTVGFTTSRGFGRKLDRIAADPHVALAYHARDHGRTDQAGFVLVQGRARVEPVDPDRDAALAEQAERYLGPLRRGRFWDRWLAAYYADRVLVTVDVDRVVRWDTEAGDGAVRRSGAGDPTPAPPSDPALGAAPRVRIRRVAKRLGRGHRLVGWRGSDGYPEVRPVRSVALAGDVLRIDAGGGPLPAGGRRAALLAHDYRHQLVGLREHHALGWLDAPSGGGAATFAVRSAGGFVAPPNKTLLLLVNGYLARRGARRRARA
jgi:hypothetical protein